jgi:uncharacterized protein YjbJ (UPF0337 family)
VDDPSVQKLKGQLKSTEGKLKKATGDNLGGTIDEITGNAQQQIAEARIRLGRKRPLSKEEELRRTQDRIIDENR